MELGQFAGRIAQEISVTMEHTVANRSLMDVVQEAPSIVTTARSGDYSGTPSAGQTTTMWRAAPAHQTVHRIFLMTLVSLVRKIDTDEPLEIPWDVSLEWRKVVHSATSRAQLAAKALDRCAGATVQKAHHHVECSV